MNRSSAQRVARVAMCVVGLTAGGASFGAAGTSAGLMSPAERDFVSTAGPLFREFCFDCHSDRRTKGHINLERMAAAPDIAALFKSWEKVIAKIEQNEMPPEEEPQPSAAQRKKLVATARGALDKFIRDSAGDPGRVAMRRLTSAEYAYTIQDLTGLELGLERTFVGDAVGGEGFSNVGDVQFIQDSALEHYLEVAKKITSHAVVGAGPLTFYRDPGKTGQELSAINRIRDIYREHGFRTGAGEGALAFGLEHYPKAFFATWRFRHRRELGLRDATLASLAQEEKLDLRFVEHIWAVLNDPSLSFAAAEIAAAWRKLPAPKRGDTTVSAEVRARCDALYQFLRHWQTALAANSGNDEEAPVLSETSFRPTLKHTFRSIVSWPRGATNVTFEIIAAPASKTAQGPVVVWRQASVRFRQPGAFGAAGGRRRGAGTPLSRLVSEERARQLNFGQGVAGSTVGTNDFVTIGSVVLPIELSIPPGAMTAEVFVDAELDLDHGGDALVRCAISSKVVEGQGQTAAASGVVSALLANPNSSRVETWKAGAVELARKLPQVSHREATPADRDPIPEPYDNSYNNPERNEFHYVIKYHRDDRFLAEHILDDATRARLDEAWTDLLTAFDYHDNFLRFVAKKYKLNLEEGLGVANLSPDWIEALPNQPRRFVRKLREEHASAQRALRSAQTGHIEDALRFAELAWRRPLSDSEKSRLRSFYASTREESKLEHPDALRALLARILVAPAFLYRIEIPIAAGNSGTVRPAAVRRSEPASARSSNDFVPLSDWEMASRLSYFLWSSLPDAELRRAAAAGELRRPEQLVRQARRMARDPKARRFATEFFGQWYGFYRFDDYRGVDTGRFGEFTDALKASLYDEAISFFEHIVREDRPVNEILFADYAFLNGDLARHYGIDPARAPTNGMARVDGVKEFHRGGLLRLGAVHAVTSAPLRTSAVKRGDWVLRRVLGTPVPPPPGDAGSIPPDDVLSDGQTVRQRLEAHRGEPSCVNCHSRIDPFGFALENFDPIGRWRDKYRDGQGIETSGRLHDGTEISGLDGLDRYLRTQETAFHRTLSAKLLGYALGRGELISDRPLIDRMTSGLKTDGRFLDLIAHIVASTQFRYASRSQREEISPNQARASIP